MSPSRSALLDWLAARMSADQVEQLLALAGEPVSEDGKRRIRQPLESGQFPQLDYDEVDALVIATTNARAKASPLEWRAYGAIVLLCTYAANDINPDCKTFLMVTLVEACERLGSESVWRGLQFFSWLAEHDAHDAQRVYHAACISLLLAALLAHEVRATVSIARSDYARFGVGPLSEWYSWPPELTAVYDDLVRGANGLMPALREVEELFTLGADASDDNE